MADYLGSRVRGMEQPTYPTGQPATVDRASRSTVHDPTSGTTRRVMAEGPNPLTPVPTVAPQPQSTNPYLPGYVLPEQAPELQYQSSVASGFSMPTPVPTLDSRIAMDQYLSRAYYGGGTDIGPGTVVGNQKAAMGQTWTPNPALPEGGYWSYTGVPNEIGTAQNYFQLYPQTPEAQNGTQYLQNLASSLGYTGPVQPYTPQAPITAQQNLPAPTPIQLPQNYLPSAPTTTPTQQPTTPPNTNNPATSQPSTNFNDMMQMYLLAQLFGIGGGQPTGYGVQTGPLGTTYWAPQYANSNPYGNLNLQDFLALAMLYGMNQNAGRWGNLFG